MVSMVWGGAFKSLGRMVHSIDEIRKTVEIPVSKGLGLKRYSHKKTSKARQIEFTNPGKNKFLQIYL